MGVVERKGRFGARLHLADGEYRWLGTFHSREAAEEAVRLARPKHRRCVKCYARFEPRQPSQMRCPGCIRDLRREDPQQPDFWLYKCYTADGELLYVGITAAGVRRFRRHGNHKSWWADVARIDVEHFESREDVHAAEIRAITELGPKHNRDYNGSGRRPRPDDEGPA